MKIKIMILLSALLFSAAACSTVVPARTATIAPSPVLPTPTALPLSQQVTLTSVPFEEDGKSPDYKITTQTPTLTGSDDQRVQSFNKEMSGFVQGFIADFKNKLAQMPNTPITASSTFDVRYTFLSPPGNILSIKFDTEGYIAGMAHPYHLSYTANYNLEQGKDIALADLFLPNSNYLETIADYCKTRLGTRDIDFKDFSQGADPTSDNYKNWNITAGGLMITFDEYQVAAYVAGPQTVTVPYSELKSIIDPQGPLAAFVK
jgi:Protein of unknown function (DUF3298)